MACTFIPFCGFCCGCLSFVALLCTSTLLHPFCKPPLRFSCPPIFLPPLMLPGLFSLVYCTQPALGTSTFCVPTQHPAVSGHPTMLPSPLLPTPGTPSPPVYLLCTFCCVPRLSSVVCVCALHCSRLWLPALSVDPVHVSWGVPALFTTCHVSSALVLPVRGTAPLPEVSAPLG